MPTAPLPPFITTHARITALPQFAVLSAHGADAVSFLHGQLTQDVQNLPANTARLAGYCSAKGRLLATMVLWRAPQDEAITATPAPEIRLLARTDLAAALAKRLAMFVLRAKVKLDIAPVTVHGVTTAPATEELSGAPWQCVHTPTGTWISAPGSQPDAVRGWWLAATPAAAPDEHAAAHWEAADIAAGLPWISAATQDLFIPQTLNLDLLNAVSFDKGCYPGQEVVARSHYRGTVKRRMAAARLTPASPQALPAADLYPPDATEPCGRLINAASVGDTTHVLFEAPLALIATGSLHLGSVQGPALAHIQGLTP